MSRFLQRFTLVAACVGLALAGCVVGPGGTYGDPNFGVGPGYYEPAGADYGGWGSNFEIGPYGYGGGVRGGIGGRQHAFRGAAPGRAMPSLARGGRGGGGRPSGGGRPGGGGGRVR